MDLNVSLLKTCESWNVKGNYQEWHNTISKDKIERIALRNARWRMLELLQQESWRTLREWIKSLMNHHVEPPWRTLVIKDDKRKRSWEHKVKPCDDLDGASRQDNAENLELRKKVEQHITEKFIPVWTPVERIKHLDETRTRIMLCVSITHIIDDKQRIWHTTYSRRKD